jgi:hypothetical protein
VKDSVGSKSESDISVLFVCRRVREMGDEQYTIKNIRGRIFPGEKVKTSWRSSEGFIVLL